MSLQKFNERVQEFKEGMIRYPNQIQLKVDRFLDRHLLGSHVHALNKGYDNSVYEFLDLLKDCNIDFDKTFATDNLIEDYCPQLFNNFVFQDVKSAMFDIKQKGFGGGEFLQSLLASGFKESNGKKGDGQINGKSNELKSGTSSSSIKAHPDASHQPTNDLWIQIYGGHNSGQSNKQIWNGTKQQFHAFCSQLYTYFYDKAIFDEIWKQPTIRDKEQLLGYYILTLGYVKIDNIGIMGMMAPTKKDLKVVCINDFSQKKFILDNIHFKPVMCRGGGTQALADGYCDIKFKGGK